MDYDKRKFQSRVEEVEMLSGKGTELVTVWVPPGKNLDTVRSRIHQENAETENIQSKRTREHVNGALRRVQNVLHKYDEVPENGLVVCAGYVEYTDDYTTYVFDDLPEPIRDSKYECSDEFAVSGLVEMAFGGSEWWGLIAVTRDTASLGRYTTSKHNYVDVIDSFDSHVQGKSNAGGFSQKRFERVRKEQRDNHYKKVIEMAKANFDPDASDFKGLAVGGPNVTVGEFVDMLPQRLSDTIVTVETIDHAGSQESLSALAQKAESAFSEQEKQLERELMGRFKNRLRDDERVAYGHEEIETAIEYGAVDTLLVSADFSTSFIDSITERVKEKGGSVEIISTMHEEGQQLDYAFGGLAALLRFDIN